MKPVQIGLLGLGTVARGVAAILARNAVEIERRAGRRIVVAGAAVRDVERAREWQRRANVDFPLSTDGRALATDRDVDVVCELIGGTDPARAWIEAAIDAGKPVVSANKALLAEAGEALFERARGAQVSFGFEAAVAGGVPVIKALREGLAGNRIEWLAGIINGTGNFILTEMADKGREFDDVLAEAQRLGYAEADPSFDIDGTDAAHKLALLGAIAFGIPLDLSAVHVEGIAGLSRQDVDYARELGYAIKHLGVARRRLDGFELRVHPTLIPERRLLANVDGVMNAVVVKGDAVGPTLYYGAGAGAEATGSAVIADVIDAVRSLDTPVDARVPPLGFRADSLEPVRAYAPDDFESAWYVRLRADDRPGVLADIAGIFGDLGVSIEALIQKEPAELPARENEEPAVTVPIIMLCRQVRQGRIREALARVDALPVVRDAPTLIRVESLR